MLEYSDFYDIAIYANEHWNGSFTTKEIAENQIYILDIKTVYLLTTDLLNQSKRMTKRLLKIGIIQ